MLEKFFTGVTSKSTDKLAILCEGINEKILSDDKLKERIKSISITWEKINDIAVPFLDVQFN